MPRGQFTDGATKLRAVAELSAGADLAELAARMGLNPKTIQTWKKTFDEGGLLDVDTSEATPEAPAAPAASASPAPSQQPPKADGTAAPFVLNDGTTLPPLPARRPDELRRKYQDDFKYLVGRALLARKAAVSHVSDHYAISATMLRDWSAQVSARKLKPSRELRQAAAAAEHASNGHAPAARSNGATRTNGAASSPPPQQQLSIEGISMPPTTQIVPYPPPPHAVPAELADLLLRVDRAETEASRLRLENERLRAQLRQAFDMVLSGAAP